MPESNPIEIRVAKPMAEVYRYLATPENYPRWAAVDEATFAQVGPLEWSALTDFGPRTVRFSPPNDEGILDHAVYAAGEEPVMMPLRLTPDGDGTRVTFIFYRRPGMTDEQLVSALEWIRTDFEVLKVLLEL
jgi:hypothetical protein